MQSVKLQLAVLVKRIDALNLRERTLIFIAIVAVLLAGWNAFVNSYFQKERNQLLQRFTEIDARRDALNWATESVLARDRIDPDRELKSQLASLNAEWDALTTRKEALAESFMPPRQMAELLQSLLKNAGSLQLVSLETAPAQPLFWGGGKENDVAKAMPEVYRHDLTIEFEGGYFDTLSYLRELERQPVFWDSIDYRVKSHPKASVRLKVYTLSFEPDWLGV